jgi:hypothetical protein
VRTEIFLRHLSDGDWLTPARARFVAACMVAGTIAMFVFLFATAHGLLDYAGRPLGTDFSSFWSAGKMALEGRAPQAYDWQAHFAVQRQFFGTERYSPWSYPPIFLMAASMFAMLPYLIAFLLWQGASLLAAAFVYLKILPWRAAILFGLGFPAVLVCLGHGQTGFLTAALLAGGILALRQNEILAGILFGLLAYKPQFGVLLPFVLAAGGYWRAFAAATVTVLAVIGLSYLIWGWPVWAAFINSIYATRTIVFETGDTGFEKFQSAFAWVRLWDGPVAAAYALQGLVAVIVFVATIRLWRSDAAFRLKGAALLTGALLVSPYTLDYDFIVLGMAIALMVAEGYERGFGPWEKTLLAFAWFVPACARSVAKTFYLPIGFLALAMLFALIVVQARGARMASDTADGRDKAARIPRR